MINVTSKEIAKKKYPHGRVESVPVMQGDRLKMFQVVYRFPQRIDAPTDEEFKSLINSGFAKEIKKDRDLKTLDIPGDSLSGSIGYAEKNIRKAAREEVGRETIKHEFRKTHKREKNTDEPSDVSEPINKENTDNE